MNKVSIIGGGFVGSSVAHILATKMTLEVVVVDIPGAIEPVMGKTLDIYEATPIYKTSSIVKASKNYEDIKNSYIVVITAGVPRKPGMSRDDLLIVNSNIIKSVAAQIKKYAQDSIVIVVTNPLDAMCYLAYKILTVERNKIIGMAGVLDSIRMATFISMELNISSESIQALVLGTHGDTMVPLPRYTTVGGIPITELMSKEKIDEINQRTKDAGAEIVKLLKTGSAYYAPAAGVYEMVDSIINDKRKLLPSSVYLDGEYGFSDVFIGVPIILGKNGVEKIIELKLEPGEFELLKKSVEAVKKLIEDIYRLKIL
ncbi:MAG: malate dehydrogenase [bacterium]|nr:malate dehydrogenase [bacterium]